MPAEISYGATPPAAPKRAPSRPTPASGRGKMRVARVGIPCGDGSKGLIVETMAPWVILMVVAFWPS